MIRTYSGDFNWLEFCLQSTKKRASGFRDIVLVMDDADASMMGPYKDKHKIVATGSTWKDGYIQQMNDKLHADLYSDADYIVHTDSDCVWTSDITPESLMEDGKPVWLMHPFGGDENPWPPIVLAALGFNSEYSFMRRHPFMVPRNIYKGYRDFMENRHQMPLRDYIISQPYHQFIEYESLGCWAFKYAHDAFVWKDQADFPTFVRQEWSWGGLTDDISKQLKEYC